MPNSGQLRNYPGFTQENPGLLLRGGGASGTGGGFSDSLPDVAVRDPSALRTAEAMEEEDNRRPIVLDDLARDYIATHRAGYVDQAWQRFGKGEYRASGDFFLLARALSIDDPAIRTDIEIGSMAASIASRQYSAAAQSLQWLLTSDRRTGDLPDPSFVNKLPKVLDRYGAKSDFELHARNIESMSNSSPTVSIFKALRSVVLWQRGDRAGAKFYAKDLADIESAPWPALKAAMDRVSSGAPSEASLTSQPADSVRPLLPSDLVATQK